jgi:dephospho-CoA kinase
MIIGVTGLIGSGKDTVADFLAHHGFTKLSLSEEIRKELRSEDIAITRATQVKKGNKLRKQHGPAVLADRVIDQMDADEDYVVVSIRNPAEVKRFRDFNDFILVHVQATDDKRLHHLRRRDDIDEATFERINQREYVNDDPAEQQLRDVIAMADETILNNGTLIELNRATNQLLEDLLQ